MRDRSVEGCDAHRAVGDAHVGQRLGGGASVDLEEASIQQGLTFSQPRAGVEWDGDGQPTRLLHGGEDGLGNELVFDGAILPTALDPDVAGAQAVAQLGEEAELKALRIDGAIAEHGGAPAGAHEAARQVFGKAPAVASVEPLQRRHRVEQRGDGAHAPERERGKEGWADPPHKRMAVRGDRRVVRALGPDQTTRLGENRGQSLPWDDIADGIGHITARCARLQQRVAHIGQQAQGVVDRLGVLLHPGIGSALGAPEEAPDQSVEQADDLVGQARRGIENRDHERRPSTKRRQRPEVLGRQPRALLRKSSDALLVHPGQYGRIDPERPRSVEPPDQSAQRLRIGGAADVAHPG